MAEPMRHVVMAIYRFLERTCQRILGKFSDTASFHGMRRPMPDSTAQKALHIQMEDTIEKFKNEDFGSIRSRFAFVLRVMLPELVLRKGWSTIQLFAGSVVSIDTPTTSIGWLINTTRTSIEFERAKMTMAMQTTKSGTIVGLRFLPASLPRFGTRDAKPLWRKPIYDVPELYEEVDMTIGSRKWAVGATMTLPLTEPKHPCVVLLSGSGPCDRDATIQAAKPFKDIASGLAKEGIASLRFDKVTLTHGKRISKMTNFTLTDEYCEHATAAVQTALRHPRIDPNAIFLAGHSLGAVVTPKLAESITSIRGFILLAPPARTVYWSAIRQLEYLSGSQSDDANSAGTSGIAQLRRAAELADSPHLSFTTPAEDLPFGIGPHYWLDSRNFKPLEKTTATNKPVLVVQGELDYQVTLLDDYACWKAALAHKDNVVLRSYKNLNHLFMSRNGPSTSADYEQPCNVDRSVIEDMARWIKANHA